MDPLLLSRDPLWRPRRRGFASPEFSMVHLNFVGWSALVGAGLAVGAILWLVSPLNAFVALPGGVMLVWATLSALDYRRWRNATTGSWRDDKSPESGREIVARLQRLGVMATYEEDEIDPEDGGGISRYIRYRNADEKKVKQVMSEVWGDAPRLKG